jgi:hypothetical protein
MVLADWVLARDDVRATIVRFEQSRRSRDPAEAWGQYPVQLFGGARAAELLTEPLSRGDWQAGHVRACSLALGPDGLLAAFVAAPATRLVRDLTLTAFSVEQVDEALAALADAPCRPALRRLRIHTAEVPIATVAPILALRTAPALTTLGLELEPAAPIADALDRVAASPLCPQLRVLELGSLSTPSARLARRYGDAFAHLQVLKLRPGDAL